MGQRDGILLALVAVLLVIIATLITLIVSPDGGYDIIDWVIEWLTRTF